MNPQNRLNLIGKTFGRWTVIKRAPNFPNRRDTIWICKCSCGVEKNILGFTLTNGTTHSCGCLRNEMTIKTHRKHGEYKSNLYKIWSAAKQRCYNPSDPAYKNYGGRGIIMSDEFQQSFIAFKNYLGNKPSPKYTVDRIDNNRGYERGNLRWATYSEQRKNSRSAHRFTVLPS